MRVNTHRHVFSPPPPQKYPEILKDIWTINLKDNKKAPKTQVGSHKDRSMSAHTHLSPGEVFCSQYSGWPEGRNPTAIFPHTHTGQPTGDVCKHPEVCFRHWAEQFSSHLISAVTPNQPMTSDDMLPGSVLSSEATSESMGFSGCDSAKEASY